MFKFRKIASVMASAAMLSSTIALAAAANFPAPFVQSGQANVDVVWGSTAGPTDVAAATDIVAVLNAALPAQTASVSSSTNTTLGAGDSFKLEKSSDKFNLGDTMSSIYATIDKDRLPTLLADGTYLNDNNDEYDYEQKITLFGRQLTFFADSDYKSKEPTAGFKIGSSTPVLNYTEDFTQDPQSDVTSGSLVDLETTSFSILGKNYYVLDAQNGTAATNFGKFTLLDSAAKEDITEGETKTVTVNGKSYEISITGVVSATKAKFTVNGELTNSLNEGETFKLSDGTYVGVREINFNSKDTGVSDVEISIGTGKIEITAGENIKLNDETVDGMSAWFVRGTPTGNKQTLDKIVVQWNTDEEAFLAPDMELLMPGLKAVKFIMKDFVRPEIEITKVDYSGDDTFELTIPIKDGDANFGILHANSTGEFNLIGSDTDQRLVTTATNNVIYRPTLGGSSYDKWFVATYNTTDDAQSFLLSATITESDGKNRTTIKNEVTGKDVCSDKTTGTTCDVGDASLTIVSVNRNSTDKWINVSAGTNVNFNTIFTKGGLKIFLPYVADSTAQGAINFTNDTFNAGHSGDSYFLFFKEENKDGNKGAGSTFNITLNDDSDGNVQVNAIDSGFTAWDVPGTSDDTITRVQSDLGTQIKKIVVSDRGKAEISYSGGQSYAEIYVSSPAVTITNSTGGGVTERGAILIKDTEIDSAAGKHIVVVGGSCINTVAATLLGSSTQICGSDFTAKTGVGAGQFLVQTFARTGDKVATLVAGYNAGDTTNAAKYLTTQPNVDTTVGKKYVGTTATQATLITT
ncbi:MAG: hypothetical protein Q7S74_01045 [Nanoarchaeota archaeon]|nr:hypothetical protein [Nanoarchaeota archaeon]